MSEFDDVRELFGIPNNKNKGDDIQQDEASEDNDEIYDGLTADKDTNITFDQKVDDLKHKTSSVKTEEIKQLPITTKEKEADDLIKKAIDAPTASIVPVVPEAAVVPAVPVVETPVAPVKPPVDKEKLNDALKKLKRVDPVKESHVEFDMETKPVEPTLGKKEEPKVEATEEEDSEDDETDSSPLPKDVVKLGDWNLTSPSPKFDRLYAEKKNLIQHILIGGRIPFDKYGDELSDCNVDVSTPIFDLPEIHRKMQSVQGQRDRVKQIQMHCNSQFFLWESSIKALEGVLARITYEKPAAKQDGVNYEHLGDMIHYFDRLRSVHRSAEYIGKHLDNAFDCLSRQLTIALPQRPIERNGVGPNVTQESVKQEVVEEIPQAVIQQQTVEIPEDLKDFDSLLTETSGGKTKWSDIPLPVKK